MRGIRDWFLVAYLLCLGFAVDRVDVATAPAAFSFLADPRLEDSIKDYHRGASLPVKMLRDAHRRARELIREARAAQGSTAAG